MLKEFLNVRLFLTLTILYSILWVLPVPGIVVYPLLGLYALKGPKQVIEAYALLFLLILSTPAIFPAGGMTYRWIVIFAGFGRAAYDVFGQGRNYPLSKRVTTLIFLFFITFLPLSIVSSKIPLISILKLVGYFCGVWAVLLSFILTTSMQVYWKKWFTTLFFFIVLSSGLILALGMGYERNGVGLQGIFSHPQVFGPVCGVIAAWLTGRALFNEQQPLWVTSVGLLSWIFIYLSQARTAVLAVVLGFLFSLFIFFILRGKKVQTSGRSQLVGIIGLFLLTFLSFGQIIRPNLIFKEFIEKRIPSTNVVEVVKESRGRLIEQSLHNFREYPVLGIGFGVPSEYETGSFGTSESFLGVPVKASVEKGFLPSAVLEETGLLGAFFTLLLIWSILSISSKRLPFSTYWLLVSTLLINLGEAAFYSIGGTGLFMWLIVGYCMNQSYAKMRSRK